MGKNKKSSAGYPVSTLQPEQLITQATILNVIITLDILLPIYQIIIAFRIS
jgi:hypothetical protein